MVQNFNQTSNTLAFRVKTLNITNAFSQAIYFPLFGLQLLN